MLSPRNPMLVAGVILLLTLGACSTQTSETTTTLAAPLATLELTEEGLGDVLLGYPPDVVIGDISALFGAPDHDSDWIPAEPNIYGSCPGQLMRAVGWGSLVALFINDSSDPLGERFFTYTYGYDYTDNIGGVDPRGLELVTDAGIGIGSTVADLESAYGTDVTINGDEVLDVWSFQISNSPTQGLLTGPKATDTVTLIELTPNCG